VAEEGSEAPGTDRVLTIPNLLSLIRLGCVPVFLWMLFGTDPPRRAAAAYLIAVLGATDWVDGYIARRFNQVSTVGKVLDPAADRILLATSVIAILVDGAIPAWIAIAAIVREVLVSIAVLALAAAGARRIDVQWVGKAGTFALMFAFPLFLGGHAPDLWWHSTARALGWGFAIPGLVLSYYAAATYVPIARAALREGRVGSST
jgi:cardiolipin synthase